MADQVKYVQKLKGKKVLVIGGSSGIGFAAAEAALEHGATVIISSSNANRVEQTVARLQKAYPSAKDRVSGHACNLGDDNTLEANLSALLEKTGQLNHIVHTAGDALAQMPLAEVTIDKIKKAGTVRLFSTILLGKLAPKYLVGGHEASITLTSGGVSERPNPDWTVVNAYATGLHGVCRGLALDLKPIRVNLVSPGAVKTELWGNMGLSDETQKQLFEHFESKLPTGRIPGPEEVAEAYIYLMKDNNITGTVLSTNGGHFLV